MSDRELVPFVREERGGKESILVVEDEGDLRALATRLLEELGYEVVSAPGGHEALHALDHRSRPFDLLLTDVVMPEMTGRELALTLQGLNPGLRCLYMSGYTADVIAHRGVLDHEVEFIQKPFSRSDLAARVREVLDRAERPADGPADEKDGGSA